MGVRLCSANGSNAVLTLCKDAEKCNAMFVTYGTLRSSDVACHIATWLGGEQAKGLIIFDEAHYAKNFIDGRGTKQGRVADYLQRACPRSMFLWSFGQDSKPRLPPPTDAPLSHSPPTTLQN